MGEERSRRPETSPDRGQDQQREGFLAPGQPVDLDELERMKKEQDAVILAHYYVNGDVQDIADYVGDSFGLSKLAANLDCRTIVFAGVTFMGESAKLLSPEKKVLMPDVRADCPMAHMVLKRTVDEARAAYDDLAVVCYVNSTAEMKSWSDVCVTSSNALKICKALPQRNILFIPDHHLGHYIAEKLPEKNFILNNGFCPRHASIDPDEVRQLKAEHPGAPFLAHPECPAEILQYADYVGSTKGIIDYATAHEGPEFLIGTVYCVVHELEKRNAGTGKRFFFPHTTPTCINMDGITLQMVFNVLKSGVENVEDPGPYAEGARRALQRMLDLAAA